MRLHVDKPILGANDEVASANRALLDAHRVACVNLLASPGAGKTTLILATAEALTGRARVGVIEGDIAGKVDADKMKERGIPCVQVNTGGLCHLEATMIERALGMLDLDAIDLLLIENVGNLVCTADFALGEHRRAVVLSVPEGHDKPVKYPGMFESADAVVVSKLDAQPVFDFDEGAFRASMRDVNPRAEIFPLSAAKGTGLGAWRAWLEGVLDDFGGTL